MRDARKTSTLQLAPSGPQLPPRASKTFVRLVSHGGVAPERLYQGLDPFELRVGGSVAACEVNRLETEYVLREPDYRRPDHGPFGQFLPSGGDRSCEPEHREGTNMLSVFVLLTRMARRSV